MITDDIFDWADRTPNATALVHNGEPWSYLAFANQIAVARGFFTRSGCQGPGVAVVATSNLRDFWVRSLALRSLGLTTIVGSAPPRGPIPRGARLVVTGLEKSSLDIAASYKNEGLEFVTVSMRDEGPLGLNPIASSDPPGGHILQTSGTTGIYKYVAMLPEFESDFMRARLDPSGLGPGSVVVVFDFPGWTGVGYKSPVSAWMSGATVVIYQGEQLHRALLHPGVTHASLVPTMLDRILAAPAGSYPRMDSLQLFITGGSITQSQIDRAKARITPRLYNLLGATEVKTIGYTALDAPEDRRWHRLVSGIDVQIVDEFDREVPTGEVGLLRVSTAGGPTGYLDDEAATRNFFRNGYFYPGDLAVSRADGRIALQGRLNEVINIAGYKVSAPPIEDRLQERLGVSGVCMFSMQNAAGDEEIHIVLESAATIALNDLAEVIRQDLPELPRARIHHAAALPRTTTGKILREAVRKRTIKGEWRD